MRNPDTGQPVGEQKPKVVKPYRIQVRKSVYDKLVAMAELEGENIKAMRERVSAAMEADTGKPMRRDWEIVDD